MQFLSEINIVNFRNIKEARLSFLPNLNVLVGLNGSGKTNLLDAIYCLCLTKSALNTPDTDLINHHSDFFACTGYFVNNEGNQKIHLSMRKSERKTIKRNDVAYKQFSEHIGRFPVVFIGPDDTNLITESGEERRKFFNALMAQADSQFLDLILEQNKLLQRRNALLKSFATNGNVNLNLLDVYDQQLIPLNIKIYNARKQFAEKMTNPIFEIYNLLAENDGDAQIEYLSQVADPNFENTYIKCRNLDIISQRTKYGVHRDDFLFKLGNKPIKQFGSQGQRKSFVLALKLSQLDVIKQTTQTNPILLLDDVFDRLDDKRIEKLITILAEKHHGQTFITDARPERSKQYLQKLSGKFLTIEVNNGTIKPPTM